MFGMSTKSPETWIIDVCKTCRKLAQWPFCEHRPKGYEPDAPSWCEPITVRKVGR